MVGWAWPSFPSGNLLESTGGCPLLPTWIDGKRHWFSLGLGVEIGDGRLGMALIP